MAEILFENIPGTRLHRPLSPASNEALLFLSITAPNAVDPLSLEATWAGTPIGYYLFLKKLPDDDTKFALEAEKALDLAAQPPDHTSFAWVAWDGKSVTVTAQIVMKAGSVVKTGTLISVPGIPGIGVDADTPIRGNKGNNGFLDGFVIAYPPQPAHDGQPASEPPWGGGLTIPMAGDYAGCFRFEALLNSGQSSSGDVTRKQIANVSFDPVRPGDSKRTRISLTGVRLDFGQLPSGAFYLEPVHAGTTAY